MHSMNSLSHTFALTLGEASSVAGSHTISKNYQSKMGFRTLATTPKGETVVASDRGELRLYDKIDKKAKTLFPGWGGTSPCVYPPATETALTWMVGPVGPRRRRSDHRRRRLQRLQVDPRDVPQLHRRHQHRGGGQRPGDGLHQVDGGQQGPSKARLPGPSPKVGISSQRVDHDRGRTARPDPAVHQAGAPGLHGRAGAVFQGLLQHWRRRRAFHRVQVRVTEGFRAGNQGLRAGPRAGFGLGTGLSIVAQDSGPPRAALPPGIRAGSGAGFGLGTGLSTVDQNSGPPRAARPCRPPDRLQRLCRFGSRRSSGSFEIRWNFRRVKAGHHFDYRILKHSDRVVADQFIYNNNRNVVVTLPDNVMVVNNAQLQSPRKPAGLPK